MEKKPKKTQQIKIKILQRHAQTHVFDGGLFNIHEFGGAVHGAVSNTKRIVFLAVHEPECIFDFFPLEGEEGCVFANGIGVGTQGHEHVIIIPAVFITDGMANEPNLATHGDTVGGSADFGEDIGGLDGVGLAETVLERRRR